MQMLHKFDSSQIEKIKETNENVYDLPQSRQKGGTYDLSGATNVQNYPGPTDATFINSAK